MPPLYSLYLSPLHKGGPYTAKLMGSFSKSFSPIAVTHLVKAKPLGFSWCSGVIGISDFHQEWQPFLQTEIVLVNLFFILHLTLFLNTRYVGGTFTATVLEKVNMYVKYHMPLGFSACPAPNILAMDTYLTVLATVLV